MRTVSLRNTFALVLLALALVVIAFNLGAFDSLVKARFRLLSQREKVEWQNSWLGIDVWQYPTDLMLYQELIHRIQPDLIVETGTCAGGNALYLASVLELVNPSGKVVTVDIDARKWKKTVDRLRARSDDEHRLLGRITFLQGSSTSPKIIRAISQMAPAGSKVLVILDSRHSKKHVLEELKRYSPLVSLNSYIIVNDTQLEGWLPSENRARPLSAVKAFLETTDRFVIDQSVPRFTVSCADEGFLKRIR